MKKLLGLFIILIMLGCSPQIIQFKNQPVYEQTFSTMEDVKENFHIVDNEFYNENDILFKADAVTVDERGLVIEVRRESGLKTTWQRTGRYNWVSGMITTWNKDTAYFAEVGGTWVIDAVFPDTWAALWLLHPDYYVPEINKNHIIPEIDFAENNGYGIENVVHYGWDIDKYRTKWVLRKMHDFDGQVHEYAVRVGKDSYTFYLDGKRINKFTRLDPSFTSTEPKYLLINNAVKGLKKFESELIIKRIRYYK